MLEFLAGFLIGFMLLIVVIYIALAIFLNKFNKLVYGKGTALAWLPVTNIYLLGKLAINKVVGWILVACVFLTSSYETTINGVTEKHTILPANISTTITNVYSFAVLILLIYAIVKYFKIKNGKGENLVQQPVQSQPIVQPVSVVDQSQPVVQPTPIMEQPQPVVQPTPVMEQPQPVVQPTPVMEQQQSVVQPTPVMEQPQSVVQPTPVMEQQQSVVQPTPVMEQPQEINVNQNSNFFDNNIK